MRLEMEGRMGKLRQIFGLILALGLGLSFYIPTGENRPKKVK